ncbi:uncharacterized protein [Onthophagus taurus]|uniref:uncharacterized protein n=1 Tax=Onthophagus taurus TaxID=166361 RepID=UPI0039BE9B62
MEEPQSQTVHFQNFTGRRIIESIFTIKCQMCGMESEVHTNGNKDELNVNTSAVIGIVSIGAGYSQLKDFFSMLNIPNMTQRRYNNIHTNLLEVVETVVSKQLKDAGEEEVAIAKGKGDVDDHGVALVSVVSDGAWSKRSYRTNYNAASGVGVIIGEATKKILHIGVRNRYCRICTEHFTNRRTHKCFKNWSGPSTAMESDIFLEGFQHSVGVHGLKYIKLIGDGDSSVTKKLNSVKPYGTCLIEKVECINHLLRNFSNKLVELSKKVRSTSGKFVPLQLRRKISTSVLRFRVAIKKSAEYRNGQNVPYEQKLLLFQKDLSNIQSHIFGDH